MYEKRSSNGLEKNELFDQKLDLIERRFRPQEDLEVSEHLKSILLRIKE